MKHGTLTLVTKKQAEQRSTQRLTCVMRRPSGVASRSPICVTRQKHGWSGHNPMMLQALADKHIDLKGCQTACCALVST